VSTWEQGQRTVEYLIDAGRLESVALEGNSDAADLILSRATRRLTTASAGFDGGDIDGAFVAAYDAYRMASESLLARQGLRATGGDGSHVTVEDAVSAQFSDDIAAEDALWAIETARSAVEGARLISESGDLARFGRS